jgi:hypothetical protein
MLTERFTSLINTDTWLLWVDIRQSFSNLSNCQLSLRHVILYPTQVSVKLSGCTLRYTITEFINKQESELWEASALFAALGKMHSWRRVWERRESYLDLVLGEADDFRWFIRPLRNLKLSLSQKRNAFIPQTSLTLCVMYFVQNICGSWKSYWNRQAPTVEKVNLKQMYVLPGSKVIYIYKNCYTYIW